MERTAFQELDVYKLSETLAQECWRLAREWRPFDRDTLGKQLVRAADSIGANIAEGYGRGDVADHKRFLRIARGSGYEVKHWLRLAFARGLVSPEQVQTLKPLLDEFAPRLNAYIKVIGKRKKPLNGKTAPTVNTQHSTIN